MPVFELESLEIADLVQYLQSLNGGRVSDTKAGLNKELVEKCKRLIQKHRCGACHELPSALRGEIQRKSIDGSSRWDAGCLNRASGKWAAWVLVAGP